MTPRHAITWQPVQEPFRVTLARTGTIAVVGGAVLSLRQGGLAHWPLATLLVLWFSLGGHWVEVAFLNWLRPRLPAARIAQLVARIAAWYVGGTLLALGMMLTAKAFSRATPPRWPWWWFGGIGFIALELVVHLFLQLRGRPSVYNGRG